MRIVAMVHFYVPYRRAGSETMLDALLQSLAARGHEVIAVATDMPEAQRRYTVGDVAVMCLPEFPASARVADLNPDVVITHHQRARRAAVSARDARAKLVLLVHNDFPDTVRAVATRRPDLAVFNTTWIAAQHAQKALSSVVVHPPVFGGEHATSPGDRVTLVNLNDDKGSRIMGELAQRMPGVGFLGVVGGHGIQRVDGYPANVDIVAHTSDMRADVWARTAILIMPSAYESYGMVAVEAMHSGIPVIATPTPGLLESIAHAGTFVEREDISGWVNAIQRVGADYAGASRRAHARAVELDPVPELARWVVAVEQLGER